ncbi:hypothetical protein K402DRAFT_377511 [Aulographum hederae CBS 113979]|uniref:histidine kinase n=1 Tax=Aulographum hederae CBS 113979 TaxID=1176131 RepID=A0A6G1GZX4_9PEZI|nr:hypothetical protein K402DRAFT_377511 [Aulographum hederae CBS 113979]
MSGHGAMASEQQPLASPSLSRTDEIRARELYKYFKPPRTYGSSQKSSPDTILTANAQLVAWRLNMERSLVSLLDDEQQYFVAEGTKTLRLDDTSQSEDPDDAIWAGCSTVSKSGKLCEYTIAIGPPEGDRIDCFEVQDLSKDERFMNLPFVSGGPKFRYYVGVPLWTKNNIPIGSLFAMDSKPREALNETDKKFLQVIAQNCMTHLEMLREKEDKKRAMAMNQALAAFVDPDHRIERYEPSKQGKQPALAGTAQPTQEKVQEGLPKDETKSTGRGSMLPNPLQRMKRKFSSGLVPKSTSEAPPDDHDTSKGSSGSTSSVDRPRVSDDEHTNTFQRASELLYDALSLGDGGGVLFLDTMSSFRRVATDSEHGSSDGEIDRRPLGATHSGGNSAHRATLSDKSIMRMIKKYPRGKLFSLDSEGLEFSSSGEDNDIKDYIYEVPSSKNVAPIRGEGPQLLKHFPAARQILFLPLWDASASRFSACFIYNSSPYRSLSTNPDLLFAIAFCNCVMAEITRIAMLADSQQKSDFIGSVSHELRSPLHGILASCEFMHDTEIDTFQKSLIDTADSCARTLLDTINQVLDYSKIASFQRNFASAKRNQKGRSSSLNQPLLNLYGDVDIAKITEEVVEGISLGTIFKDSSSYLDVEDLEANATATSRGPHKSKQKPRSGAGVANLSSLSRANVEVILDLDSSLQDQSFVTQPGAYRRVVMNLFGNALKYTRSGFIRLSLKMVLQEDAPNASNGERPASYVKLTVTDSGQGMSQDYLRTKLFTPFSQESSMAPGTGLGLSLVRSIVNMLAGDISISSTQGVGTEVIVKLPMSQGSVPNSNSNSTPSTAGSSVEREKDNSPTVVQNQSGGKTVALFFDPNEFTEASQMLRSSLRHYLKDWYGFSVVDWTRKAKCDMIIVEEPDLEAFKAANANKTGAQDGAMILVLCSAASRKGQKAVLDSPNVGVLYHPFGPHKLARALRLCLEKQGRLGADATAGADFPIPITGDLDNEVEPIDDVINVMEKVTLTNTDPDIPDVSLIQSGDILAREDSIAAQKAMDSLPNTDSSNDSRDPAPEFPFPIEVKDGTVSPGTIPANVNPPPKPTAADSRDSSASPAASTHTLTARPSLELRRTIDPTNPELAAHATSTAAPISLAGAITNQPPGPPPATRDPRLMLVDDNPVNLKLIQMFMKKRKYTAVTSAENGLVAVTRFTELTLQDPPCTPDIIFMDISMPVMDGFEATRRIRAVEAEVREKCAPTETPEPSLVIALTGLASGRDQSEAFASGFDLYLTKPVSMREVGRLLDNWRANGGVKGEGVPSGGVSGESVGVGGGSLGKADGGGGGIVRSSEGLPSRLEL